jgi:hypothetical protein
VVETWNWWLISLVAKIKDVWSCTSLLLHDMMPKLAQWQLCLYHVQTITLMDLNDMLLKYSAWHISNIWCTFLA